MDKQTIKGFERYGTYEPSRTGLLLVDPYNDFIHPDGKSYPKAKEVIEGVNLLDNLRRIVKKAREMNIRVFYVPHHRTSPGDLSTWKYPTAGQLSTVERLVFQKGSWGGEFHADFQTQPGDVVVQEHFGQSGFANTDLDRLLKQHGVEKIILIGMLANSCIESTGRFGMELGYHVTLVKDATAAFGWDLMHAAHDLNGPTFAHAIMTSDELLNILQGKPIPAEEEVASK